MNKVKILLIIFIFIVIILCGCWDKVEINNRAFVSAIGIDLYQKEPFDLDESLEEEKYEVTYELHNLKSIGKNGDGSPRFVMTNKGRNVNEVFKKHTTVSNKTLYLGHAKVIVIGEEAAKDSDFFREILDGAERDPMIGRKINILIATGSAKNILETEPEIEPVVGNFISELEEAKQTSARFNPLTLGDLLPDLHDSACALMPRVMKYEDSLKISGSAVIKEYKLEGWLDDIETRAIMFIKNLVYFDEVTVVHNDIMIPYNITSTNCTKKVYEQDGRLVLMLNLDTEGFIEQYKLDEEKDLFNDKLLKNIEKKVEAELKTEIEDVVKTLQKKYKVDLINAGEYLEKYKPSLWSKVKNNWIQTFCNMEIKVTVDSSIRRIGLVK